MLRIRGANTIQPGLALSVFLTELTQTRDAGAGALVAHLVHIGAVYNIQPTAVLALLHDVALASRLAVRAGALVARAVVQAEVGGPIRVTSGVTLAGTV
jgi:hypothetical protein